MKSVILFFLFIQPLLCIHQNQLKAQNTIKRLTKKDLRVSEHANTLVVLHSTLNHIDSIAAWAEIACISPLLPFILKTARFIKALDKSIRLAIKTYSAIARVQYSSFQIVKIKRKRRRLCGLPKVVDWNLQNNVLGKFSGKLWGAILFKKKRGNFHWDYHNTKVLPL